MQYFGLQSYGVDGSWLIISQTLRAFVSLREKGMTVDGGAMILIRSVEMQYFGLQSYGVDGSWLIISETLRAFVSLCEKGMTVDGGAIRYLWQFPLSFVQSQTNQNPLPANPSH